MAEFVVPDVKEKRARYDAILPQLRALVEGEPDLIANLSNIAAALKQGMDFWWVGFYFVKGDELVLGPYQGPVACTRIGFGKGVCGTAWKEARPILVPDVNRFPGHIACSAVTRSEIVMPISGQGKVKLILDIDSERLDAFDGTDREALAVVTKLIELML